jgi:hypothetical protein
MVEGSEVVSSKATIFVKFTQEGIHCWKDAPDGPRAYLRNPHRHLFVIEARTEVEHDDRQLEFFDVRDQIEGLFGLIAGPARDLGSQSCEMLARRIGMHLVEWSGGKHTWAVTVSEDGEAGASVTSWAAPRG